MSAFLRTLTIGVTKVCKINPNLQNISEVIMWKLSGDKERSHLALNA